MILIVVVALLLVVTSYKVRPNIIILIADDLGWNDVGYHHSQIPTPNIDKLSYNGVRLENYYFHTTCTPSRASLFTGKFSSNVGLNHALMGYSPYGINNRHQMLSQELKKYGYHNHYIGKWHLGFSNESYTPLHKSYDSFFGLYNGAATHYEQKIEFVHDLHDNVNPIINTNKTYSTDLFTQKTLHIVNNHNKTYPLHAVLSYQAAHTPLQAPTKYLNHCQHIINNHRYLHCGMIVSIDYSFKQIVESLKLNDMWNNTILFFTSDNGAQPCFGGSNYPLRGGKNTLYDGGLKGIAFLSGGYIEHLKTSNTYYGLMHISDIYPSFMYAVDNNYDSSHVDGNIILNHILNNVSIRYRFLILHYDKNDNKIALKYDKWKLISGYAGDHTLYKKYDNNYFYHFRVLSIIKHYLTIFIPDESFFLCEIFKEIIDRAQFRFYSSITRSNGIKLFDTYADPTESFNVAKYHPDIIDSMFELLYNNIDHSQEHYNLLLMDTNFKNIIINDTKFMTSWIKYNDTTYNSTLTIFLRFYLRKIINKFMSNMY